jgi:hypothetical protein
MRIGSQAGYLLEIADMRAIGFTVRLKQVGTLLHKKRN